MLEAKQTSKTLASGAWDTAMLRAHGQAQLTPAEAPAAAQAKRPWPKPLAEQVQALARALAAQPSPVTPQQLARQFQRAPTKRVAELLETLATLGQAHPLPYGKYRVARV